MEGESDERWVELKVGIHGLETRSRANFDSSSSRSREVLKTA